MPTLVTRYVNTGSTAGGDGTTNATAGANRAFATMAEWQATMVTDLQAADENHHVICDNSGGDDTTQLIVDAAWNTDATRDILIEAAAGSRNNGVIDAGYVISGAASNWYRLNTSYVTVKGFQIESSNAQNMVTSFGTPGASSLQKFVDCIFRYTSATLSGDYIARPQAAYTTQYENCIVVGNARGADLRTTAAGSTVDHCTFDNAGGTSTFGVIFDSAVEITNTVVNGYGTCFLNSTGGTGSHNASSDTTASSAFGTDPDAVVSITDTDEFTDPAALDFSLLATSDLINAGTGSLATDITGASRATPDIGAFEYIAPGGGGSIIPQVMHHRRLMGVS